MITIGKKRVMAKDEIANFLESNAQGVLSELSKSSLDNAATEMFTAKGLDCPVSIIVRERKTYIINREVLKSQTA